MWVYKGNSLDSRLRLRPAIGNWLDYWLFLHAEETHPVWCSRPLGLRQLAQAALESTGKHDRALREQLAQEATSAVRIISFLTGVPSPPSSDPLAVSGWDPTWTRWFEAIRETELALLVPQLAGGIYRALADSNYSTAFFLTRRLAAEITEDDWSRHGSFTAVKRAICDGGALADCDVTQEEFVDLLSSAIAPQPPESFVVTVPVARTGITRTVAKKFYRNPRLRVEEDKDGSPVLTAIEVKLEASRIEDAASESLDAARKVLEDLRLVFYVRTHLSGALLVRRSVPAELSVHLSLPQPFWSKAEGRREVPHLPPRFARVVAALPDEEASRWNAARWHLSQAFADWPEDSHTSAAHVWQALEAFAGGSHNATRLIPPYLKHAVPDMGEHFATRVSLQARELTVLGHSCDWYYWVAKHVTFSRWLARVLDERSTNCYTRWSSPPAPFVGFDRSLGALQIVNRKLSDPTTESWMEKRLQADLALLYGLRNKAVHSGREVFGRRTARYLGQTGAEVLFGAMAKRAAEVGGS